MNELVRQRATVTFAALVLITFASFWLTVGHGGPLLGDTGSLLWASVILLAFIKVRWIMLDFMELRRAPVKLRMVFELWAAGVCAALIAANALIA